MVKWFKKGEQFEKEALQLRGDVLSSAIDALVPELMHLEVCRALVKVRYPYDKVEEAYVTLTEMTEPGFLRSVSTTVLKEKAKDLIMRQNLYVADALSLATAIVNYSNYLTEDKHLLKQKVNDIMKEQGLKIIRLSELYS